MTRSEKVTVYEQLKNFWIAYHEMKIARHEFKITQTRMKYVKRLNKLYPESDTSK
jgi:hypothetical protein